MVKSPEEIDGLYQKYLEGLGAYSSIESLAIHHGPIKTWDEWQQLTPQDQEYFANSSHPTFGSNEGTSGCPKKRSF